MTDFFFDRINLQSKPWQISAKYGIVLYWKSDKIHRDENIIKLRVLIIRLKNAIP